MPFRALVDSSYRGEAQFELTILQLVLGVLALHIPYFLEALLALVIPRILKVGYYLFIFTSVFLGEVLSFYYLVGVWDDILHLASSLMLGFFSYSLIGLIDRKNGQNQTHSPVLILLFTISFSLLIGVLWEIYEYLADGILGLNMQKFLYPDGDTLTAFTGRAALTDTMQDLIVDLSGATAASLFILLSLRIKPSILRSLVIVKREKAITAAEKKTQPT